MTVWFTSDLHLGHENIIRYCDRPFSSVEEMDDEICRRWAETVAEDDTVWVLGDVCLGDAIRGLVRVAELPGRKVLVPGNHDRIWDGNRMHPDLRKLWAGRYLSAFDEIIGGVGCAINLRGGVRVGLSHFPYDRDLRFRSRLDEWRPEDRGDWLLHGHAHGGLGPVHGRQIDVGVDCWDFTPVSWEQILGIIEGAGR